MDAWKVTHYRLFSVPEIEKIKIQRRTEHRVYFNDRFENIIVHDYHFPHHWFFDEKEAVQFVINTIKRNYRITQEHLNELRDAMDGFKKMESEI